jgi:hypothetical protein
MNHAPLRSLEALLTRRHWLALAGASSLSACGGGGSAADEGPTAHPLGVATGGTGRVKSFISAAVTATTPLAVGAISLDTHGASIVDGTGQPLRESALAAGMTARVLAGSVVNGAAQAVAVSVDSQAAGPASWVDSRTLLVLGQRVSISGSTARGPGAAGTPADVVVWGQLDLVAGRIVASRLERRTPGDAVMLRGVLSALDSSAGWLQVGTLRARALTPGVIPPDLAPGAVVRLALGDPLRDGSWQLLEARDDALRPPDGLHAELEGRVTQFTSAQQFSLDGVPVDASRAQIEGLAQLQLGAAAEVHGTMHQGVLVATEVAAEAPEAMELSGRLTGLDAAGQTFLLQGWRVRWDATTRFRGGASAGLRAGRTLTVKASWRPGDAALQALQITLE